MSTFVFQRLLKPSPQLGATGAEVGKLGRIDGDGSVLTRVVHPQDTANHRFVRVLNRGRFHLSTLRVEDVVCYGWIADITYEMVRR